jgi:hypothetical protein
MGLSGSMEFVSSAILRHSSMEVDANVYLDILVMERFVDLILNLPMSLWAWRAVYRKRWYL